MAPHKATVVKPSPARERAVTSPANMMTRVVNPAIAAMIDDTSYDDSAGNDEVDAGLLFSLDALPTMLSNVHATTNGIRQEQRGEMVPVRKESDRLQRIGDFEKRKELSSPWRDLQQSKKDADNAHGNDNEGQKTPFAIAERSVPRKIASGGMSESALSQVASGDTLIGIQGIGFPKSSNASTEGCLGFGSAVQEGGRGTSWRSGTTAMATQNDNANRACLVSGKLTYLPD